MSTVHGDSRRAGGAIGFETRDFYLACYLRCTGYDLIDLRAEGRRKVFVFRDRPPRRDDVLAFYGQGAAQERLGAAVLPLGPVKVAQPGQPLHPDANDCLVAAGLDPSAAADLTARGPLTEGATAGDQALTALLEGG